MGEQVGDWRRWIRQDVSNVRPLGGYAAKRCPVRTQLDVLRPVEPAGVSAFLQGLGAAGVAFEGEVFDDLADAFDLDAVEGPTDRGERERETLEAMDRGDAVIAGGRLPTDTEGRRVGEPDVLVRVGDAPVQGRWRYAPADVKGHGILRPGRGHDVVVQTVEDLDVPDGDAEQERRPDGRKDGVARGDLLQLAHYHRMLEACGRAAIGAPWGAIIGAEGFAAWFRLDEPLWSTPTNDPDRATKDRSSLDVYDFEFAFRLDIAAVAGQHAADTSVDLLVAPMHCGECSECPWRLHCWPQMEASGDVSRLPGTTYADWRTLREAGLGTVPALAAAPDGLTLEGIRDKKLRDLRDHARARLGSDPVHTRGPQAPPVPTADIEVDVDMENVAEGAYLWGATVTVRRPDLVGIEAGHHAFVTWNQPLDGPAAADVFARFWSWLTDLRDRAEQQDASILVVCWSASAENRFLRQGAALLGGEVCDEVDAFIQSPVWLDLLAWFRKGFITGTGTGLKVIATSLGFGWRDEDPGGAASIVWYGEATDPQASPEVRAAARERLLAYNEDDVLATLHVRDALRAGTWGPPPVP